MPVSATRRNTRSPSVPPVMVMEPWGLLYLMALVMMLMMTCWMRSASPSTSGSASGRDGTLYLFCYENATGDRLADYPDQDVVTYYMSAGATSVRTRIIGGRKFVCYRAVVLTEEGEQTWDTYETWDEALQISFETQMAESTVLPMLATIAFE